ncbi:hypothetical protein GQ53DRAFT_759332 [Thozetella sp. PMI_491]|nr:hypothetical protein GQ53DRAFT_759332 [Thozetella sp. PMI_491]
MASAEPDPKLEEKSGTPPALGSQTGSTAVSRSESDLEESWKDRFKAVALVDLSVSENTSRIRAFQAENGDGLYYLAQADLKGWPQSQVRDLIQALLEGDRIMIRPDRSPKECFLFDAIKLDNYTFIAALLSVADRDKLGLIILSPYDEYDRSCLHLAIDCRCPFTSELIDIHEPQARRVFREKDVRGHAPLHRAVLQTPDPPHPPNSRAFRADDIVSQLIAKDAQVLSYQDSGGYTPYRLRLHCMDRLPPRRHGLISARQEPRPGGEVPLLGENRTDDSILERIQEAVVRLLAPDAMSKALLSAPTRFRKDFVTLFSSLRRNGVCKIIELSVNDLEGSGHSDEAIEDALGGFEVERWNWKRDDIPSWVIANCSGVVREIDIYFSGDEKVLQEWLGPDGFRHKIHFPETRERMANLDVKRVSKSSSRRVVCVSKLNG